MARPDGPVGTGVEDLVSKRLSIMVVAVSETANVMVANLNAVGTVGRPQACGAHPAVTNDTTVADLHPRRPDSRTDRPRVNISGASPMAPSIGAVDEQAPQKAVSREAKKKGCKKAKCSKWKGGKCRCGRD